MWLKFVVVGLKVGPKSKATETFLSCDINECPFTVSEQSLAAFSFPLGPDSQTPKDRMAPEEYMFTLTQGDGTRVQGFCRRFLPPAPRVGSRLRYPQVLCLVCQASWSAFFFKVLEVLEQLLRQTDLLLDPSIKQLPTNTYAGVFLRELGQVLATEPPLGSVVRLQLPQSPTPLSISPPKRVGPGMDTMPLACTEEHLELQVPPDCGNGAHNAGVSLARLLWHVPVPAMVTLIASLLMERRVVVVGQSRDMVSAAVCAAAALIYPFKWHHIYLPLLPVSFKDYLTAPMPFLIGLPAQLLPALKGIPMDEVTMIDLDLQKCEPAPGTVADDAHKLPWREMLEGALHAAFSMLRSPTEHESNPLIASIMQGYFLKLVGTYRSHIYPEGCGPPLMAPGGSPTPHSPHSGRSTPGVRGDSIAGSGYWFDQAGLLSFHRRNEKARSMLELFRQSQMYEVFVQERLAAAAADKDFETIDTPFEQRVTTYMDNRSRRVAVILSAGMRSSLQRFSAFVKKHRRSERLGEAEVARLRQLAGAFAAGLGGNMRRIGSEGTLGASQLWGSLRGSSNPGGSATAGLEPQRSSNGAGGVAAADLLDPSAFFEDEEEEIEEAEALAAGASVGQQGGRFSRSSSSSSLKDLATTSSTGLSAAGGAGGGTGGSVSAAGAARSGSPFTAGVAPGTLGRCSAPVPGTRGSSSSYQQQQQQQAAVAGSRSGPGHAMTATTAGMPGGPAAVVAPLIDLDTSPVKQRPPAQASSSSSSLAVEGSSFSFSYQQQQQAAAPSATVSGHSRSHSAIPAFSYHPSTSGGGGSGSAAAGLGAAGGTRPSLLHVRTALAAIPAGPLPLPPQPRNALHPAGLQTAPARTGPAVSFSGAPPPAPPAGAAGVAGARQGDPIPPAAAAAVLEKKAALVSGSEWAVSSPASTCSSGSFIGVGPPAAAAAAAGAGGLGDDSWDPFAELALEERRVSVSECGHSAALWAATSTSGSGSSRGYYSSSGEGAAADAGPGRPGPGGSRSGTAAAAAAAAGSRSGTGSGAAAGASGFGSFDGFSTLASEPKYGGIPTAGSSRLGRGSGAAWPALQQQQQQEAAAEAGFPSALTAPSGPGSSGPAFLGSAAPAGQQQTQQVGQKDPWAGLVNQQQEVMVGGDTQMQRSLSLLD